MKKWLSSMGQCLSGAWRRATVRRRVWWATPVLWWALSIGLLIVQRDVAVVLQGLSVGASDAAVAAGFQHVYDATLYLTLALAAVCMSGFFLLGVPPEGHPPLWGRKSLRVLALLGVMAGLVLAQGAWRCLVPPPPYTGGMVEGVRFFIGIQTSLIQATMMVWSVVGLTVFLAGPADWVRCLRASAVKAAPKAEAAPIASKKNHRKSRPS